MIGLPVGSACSEMDGCVKPEVVVPVNSAAIVPAAVPLPSVKVIVSAAALESVLEAHTTRPEAWLPLLKVMEFTGFQVLPCVSETLLTVHGVVPEQRTAAIRVLLASVLPA